MKESIAIIWYWEDIKEQDETLTKEECCEILDIIDRGYDANLGICWDMIDINIREYKRIKGNK
jgi:hypothetical protein